MIYGSVCSGIEAASVAMKTCARCHAAKPLTAFHRSRNTKDGRHSWCAGCATAAQKASRERNYTPEQKRKWQLKTRYGLTVEGVDALLAKQHGKCGICDVTLVKYHVDHCHQTRRVRGLLCHRCNLMIGGLDDPDFRAHAIAWLERGA